MLLDGVRRLLDWLAEQGVDTTQIGRRRYEQARCASGLAGVPGADALRRRFGLPLARVLRVAKTEPGERGRRLAQLRWSDPFVGDDEQLLRAMRSARPAIEGNFTAIQYSAWAAAQARSRRRGRRLGPMTPSSETIIARHGDWAAACRAAGIAPPEPHPRPRAEAPELLLSWAIDRLGAVPPERYLRDLWRNEGVLFGKLVVSYPEVIERARRLRAAEGRCSPTRVTPSADLPRLAPRPARPPRDADTRYSRAQVLASIRRYAELAGPGVSLRIRHYQALRRQHPELLPRYALSRHGRFQDLVREALTLEQVR